MNSTVVRSRLPDTLDDASKHQVSASGQEYARATHGQDEHAPANYSVKVRSLLPDLSNLALGLLLPGQTMLGYGLGPHLPRAGSGRIRTSALGTLA